MNGINQLMSKALSNIELSNALDGKVRILTYAELTQYSDLISALGPERAMILLYETKEHSGHWICIYETTGEGGKISFFDSYALKPDDELYFVPDHFRRRRNMEFPHLSKLLLECKRPIEYNHHKFQKSGRDIATCGRHCIVRLLLKKIPLKRYIELLKDGDGFTSDQLVTYMTRDI